MPDTSKRDDIVKQAAEAFSGAIEGAANVWGGHASDAAALSPDEELKLYRMPTSPAARRAFELGGSLQDAERANAMWAQSQQATANQIRQAGMARGATSDQITQVLSQHNLTDEQIFAQARQHAATLAKQNGRNKPTAEVEYHERLAKRLHEQRSSEQASRPADQRRAVRQASSSAVNSSALHSSAGRR